MNSAPDTRGLIRNYNEEGRCIQKCTVDAQYKLVKNERNALKKQINAVQKRINAIDKAKEKIRKNMI